MREFESEFAGTEGIQRAWAILEFGIKHSWSLLPKSHAGELVSQARELIDAEQEGSDRRDELEAAWELARALQESDWEAAEQRFATALSFLDDRDAPKARALHALAKSKWLAVEERFEEARALVEEALFAVTDAHRSLRAHLFTHLGKLLSELGQTSRALKYQQRGAAELSSIDDYYGLCYALTVLANSQSRLGDLEGALENYHRLLENARKRRDSPCVARTLQNLGAAHLNLERNEDALSCFDEALELMDCESQPLLHANTLHCRASVLAVLGRREEALASMTGAMEVATMYGERDRASRLCALGMLQDKLDDPRAALETFEKALQLLECHPFPAYEQKTRLGIASALRRLGRTEDAIRYLEEAIELSGRAGNKWVAANVHRSLAEALRESGQHADAFDQLELAHRLDRESLNEGTGARIESLQARLELDRAEFRESMLRELHAQLEQLVEDRTIELRKANEELEHAVAARLRTDREYGELEQALLQAQKQEAMGRIAAGIAHDFNNVLMTINGYSELLLSKQGESCLELQEIVHAGRRGAELTDKLLAFSRKSPVRLGPVDPEHLIREFEGMVSPIVGADIEVEIDLEPDLPPVCGDANGLLQVLVNLAINARDAMDRGERLKIRVRAVSDAPAPHLGDGQYVAFEFSDTGCGIPSKDLERVFDPFFTTKRRGEGTGLGLATASGFVKQCGGAITVESEAGCGSTFRVFLPVETSTATPAESSDSDVSPEARLEARPEAAAILLVEDDASIRELIATALTRFGHRVLSAADGEEAWVLFDQTPKIDVVVSDVAMPGLDGSALRERVRERQPDVPFVFTSGHVDLESKFFETLEPNCAFLRKPFRLEELARKVVELTSSK